MLSSRTDTANRIYRGFVSVAVDFRMEDIDTALDAGVRFIELMKQCGASSDYISDLARGLYDELRNREGECLRDLDNAGLDPVSGIDFSELTALLGSET